jgi:hypothetical protein
MALTKAIPGLTPIAAAGWLARENGTSSAGNPTGNNPLGLMYATAVGFGIPAGEDSAGHATFPDMDTAAAAYWTYLQAGAQAGVPGYSAIVASLNTGNPSQQLSAISSSGWAGTGGYDPPLPSASDITTQYPWLVNQRAGGPPPVGGATGGPGESSAKSGAANAPAPNSTQATGPGADLLQWLEGNIQTVIQWAIVAGAIVAAFIVVLRATGGSHVIMEAAKGSA